MTRVPLPAPTTRASPGGPRASLGPIRGAWWVGAGERLSDDERAVAEVLTAGERRAARRAVLTGQPASDAAAARFALVATRASRRQIVVNPFVQALPVLFMGLLFAGVAWELIGDRDWLGAGLSIAVAAVFVPLGLLMPFAYRRLERGVAANEALLSAADREQVAALAPPAAPTRRSRIGDLVGYCAAITVVRLVLFGEGLPESAVGGAIFAALFVGVPWIWQELRGR